MPKVSKMQKRDWDESCFYPPNPKDELICSNKTIHEAFLCIAKQFKTNTKNVKAIR